MSNKPKTSKASTSKSAKPKSTTDQGSSSKSDPKVIVEVSEVPVTKHKDTPKFKTTSVNRQKEPASASAKGKGKGKEKLEDKKIAQKRHFEDQGSAPATKCKFMNTFFNKDPWLIFGLIFRIVARLDPTVVKTINKAEENSREALGNIKEIKELLLKALEKFQENKSDAEDNSDAEEDVDIKGKGKRKTQKKPWYHVSKIYLPFLVYLYL